MTPLMKSLLVRAALGEDLKSSDREEDRAKTKLKKLGCITFDRAMWRWYITPDGLRTLEEQAR